MAISTKKKKVARKKKCKACGERFHPERHFQKGCNIKCAIEIVNNDNKKRARKQTREDREKLKSLSELLGDAQKPFNAYIRMRDNNNPCISCERHHMGQYHAGHYRTVGAHPELRFDENNCHKQCSPCNNHLSGNIIEYRKGLVKKIGVEQVEVLEGPHEPKNYTKEDAREIKAYYKTKLKEGNPR